MKSRENEKCCRCIDDGPHNTKTGNFERLNNSLSSVELPCLTSPRTNSLIALALPTHYHALPSVEEDVIDTFQVSYSTITPHNFDDTPTVNVSQPTQSAAITDRSQLQQPWHRHSVSDLTSECDYTHNVDQMTPFDRRMSIPHWEPERQTGNAEINRKHRLIELILVTHRAFLIHFYKERAAMTRAFALDHLELMIAILEKEESLHRNHIRNACHMNLTMLAHRIPSLTQATYSQDGMRQQLSSKSRDASQYNAFEPASADFSTSSLSSEEVVGRERWRVMPPGRAHSAPHGGGARVVLPAEVDRPAEEGLRRMATALPLGFQQLRQPTLLSGYDRRCSRQGLSFRSQAFSSLSSVGNVG
ncbi:unnamed protein product [Phytomonas sp. EM1]|nr:unnamed protein product [Phytomonas sp. EM1]|eukprot:CCW64218.1 unnamed protein product [Phytomonas sp. isolate EM1]